MGERVNCSTPGCEGTYRPSPRRQTDLCKPCATRRSAADPERRRKVAEGMKRVHQDPDFRKKREPLMKALGARNKADPSWRQKASANARAMGKKHGGTIAGSANRKKAGRSLTERYIGHIPPEYRDEYRRLSHKTHLSAEERTRLVLEMAAADTQRYIRTGEMQQAKRSQK